jgi:transposase
MASETPPPSQIMWRMLPSLDEALCDLIQPLLTSLPHRPKGGRPRLPDRSCLTGILFVLCSGIPWEMLPQELGCGSGITCWRRLRDWQEAGIHGQIDWSQAALDRPERAQHRRLSNQTQVPKVPDRFPDHGFRGSHEISRGSGTLAEPVAVLATSVLREITAGGDLCRHRQPLISPNLTSLVSRKGSVNKPRLSPEGPHPGQSAFRIDSVQGTQKFLPGYSKFLLEYGQHGLGFHAEADALVPLSI